MYDLISDNILVHPTGASYLYKLPTYNTKLGTPEAKRLANKLIVEIITKLGMKGELVIVPRRSSPSAFVANYYDRSSIIQKRYASELNELLKTKNLQEYQTYLILNETNVKQGKKTRFSTKKPMEITSGRKKALRSLSKLYLKELVSIVKEIDIVPANETIELCNYMQFNHRKVTDDYIFEYSTTSITSVSEVTDTGEKRKVNSLYFQISKFPDNYKEPTKLMEMIKEYQFPIDIVIKFDVNLNNIQLEKEMRRHKNNFKSKNKKYKRDTQDNEGLYEYNEKKAIAQMAQREMQRNDSALIEMQFNFRLATNSSKEIIFKRYEKLKKQLRAFNVETISCLGKQEQMLRNFQIGNLSFGENIHSFGTGFVQKLSLLSGSKIGMPDLNTSKIACYEVPSNIPVLIDEYASLRGDSAKTQGTTAYCGSSGSGKSQLLNSHMLQNVIVNKAKALVIDPKGDRENFFLGEQMIDKYTELVIGENLKYKGLMDLFDVNDKSSSIINIIDFIKLLFKLSESLHDFDLPKVNTTLESYINSSNSLSMTGYLRYIELLNNGDGFTSKLIEILRAFENLPYANLFYGNELTPKISYDSDLTIIILSSIDDSSGNVTIKKELFKFVYMHVNMFAKNFLRSIPRDTPSEITLEEVEYLKEQTGSYLENEISRIARSFGALFRYALQNPSGITEATKNNTGTWYVGKLESPSEFDLVVREFNLEPRQVSFLQTTNNQEGIKESQKYNFLLIDTNNRKSKIKASFVPMFEKMFDTHVKNIGDDKIEIET
ncbi:ATP-binding protein [Mollicutes bacterium LVI A0039]|nr:ATP-binding protein [Mollicutes bacterium LVI A0039]